MRRHMVCVVCNIIEKEEKKGAKAPLRTDNVDIIFMAL